VRLTIRAKQIAGVTAIVGVAVVALSALHVARLADVLVHESRSRAAMLALTILHRAGQVQIDPANPYGSLRTDPGLQSILQSSIYGESIIDAAILDVNGFIVAHSDPGLVGQKLSARADLATLDEAKPLTKLATIYRGEGETLDVRQLMVLDDKAFGSIHVGASTVFMRNELTQSLSPALLTAAAALGVGIFVAALLAQLVLRPIHVIRSGLTRLGRGEFGVTLDLPPGDEFGELGSFFNTISQQLSADRTLLAGQKANLQSAVEHLEDAVALFNPSGELLFSNPAMQQVLPADAIGRAMDGLLPTSHPYRGLVEETLATRKSRGPVHLTLKLQGSGIRDQGSGTRTRPERPGSADPESLIPDPSTERLVMTHAIAGADGALVGVLLVSRDLAYLSRMQSTIAYSRKLVALGRLTAGIAHEVKNPLNAMMIHLELLRTKIRRSALAPAAVGAGGPGSHRGDSPSESAVLEHVQIIESEIRRLDEVVQGFLKFTRPEDLRLQPVRVSMLFEEILPIVEPEAKKNNVRVVVECPDGLPPVNGDSTMLRQAFLNLAINACQAMPNGGTLRLTAAPASGHRVEVQIEDTGVGIPPAHLGRIFDLYFTTKDHGTGIGLSMVYRIIQMHDGEIEVQSTPGRGTTFTLLLPRANEM
jgi:signal transduction histidine kinase